MCKSTKRVAAAQYEHVSRSRGLPCFPPAHASLRGRGMRTSRDTKARQAVAHIFIKIIECLVAFVGRKGHSCRHSRDCEISGQTR